MGIIDNNEMLYNIYEKLGISNFMYVMNFMIYRLELS